jgi:signal transduction histidine kinase/CheY-like chemotaxis protein
MLKIEKGSGKLLRVPRLGLRTQPLGGAYDLARVITSNPEEFFSEIDEKLFVVGANVGPRGGGPRSADSDSPPEPSFAQGSIRADLLALDLNGRTVAVLVETAHKPSSFARALLCSEWLAGWRPLDFLDFLGEQATERLREFLLAGFEQLNRDQRLILVAEGHGNEILWAAQSLRKQCGIDITLLRATLAADAGNSEHYLWFRREFPATENEWATLVRPQGAVEALLPETDTFAGPTECAAPAAEEEVPTNASSISPSDGKEEALRTLAGGLADYLSQAMAAVDGSAELARREIPRDSGARPRFEEISRVAERVGKLSDELRVYAGRGARNVEKLALGSLVERVVESAGCLLLPNIRLRTELARDLPECEGDAAQIARVVANLLDNAVEALPEQGGAIRVGAGRFSADRAYLAGCVAGSDLPEGEYLYVEVADSGYGMDDGLQARVFDPFFTTKSPGRGLGLAAVAGIARNHRGALRLESRPGEGSTFRVLLPLPKQAVDAVVEGGAVSIGAGRTVLVVEDDENLRSLARQTLEADGFLVVTAADGWDALEVFAKAAETIDLVVLDWMLPNMDAEEAYRALRRIRNDTRILVCGPFPEEEASRRFAGKKLTAYIRSPFRPERLAGCARELLAERAASSGAQAS